MAAQLVAGPQRPFEIDVRPGCQLAERGLAERLVRDIDGKFGALTMRLDRRCRQTDAVAADRKPASPGWSA